MDIDGIWEIIMYGENHVSEGYLWYFICVSYGERRLYKRGSCCEKGLWRVLVRIWESWGCLSNTFLGYSFRAIILFPFHFPLYLHPPLDHTLWSCLFSVSINIFWIEFHRRYQSTDPGIKKIMEKNFEERVLNTMLKILEKYPYYRDDKKFVYEKRNS